jgi:hypothetical protein
LDAPRLNSLIPQNPQALSFYTLEKLRKEMATFRDDPKEKRGHFIAFVLDTICGFNASNGGWYNLGIQVSSPIVIDCFWRRKGSGRIFGKRQFGAVY